MSMSHISGCDGVHGPLQPCYVRADTNRRAGPAAGPGELRHWRATALIGAIIEVASGLSILASWAWIKSDPGTSSWGVTALLNVGLLAGGLGWYLRFGIGWAIGCGFQVFRAVLALSLVFVFLDFVELFEHGTCGGHVTIETCIRSFETRMDVGFGALVAASFTSAALLWHLRSHGRA